MSLSPRTKPTFSRSRTFAGAAVMALALLAAPAGAQRAGGPSGQVPGRGAAPAPPQAPPPPAQRPPGTADPTRAREAGPKAVAAPIPDARLVRERMNDKKRKDEGDDTCTPPSVAPAADRFDWDAWWETSGAAAAASGAPARAAAGGDRASLARVAAEAIRRTVDDAEPLVRETSVLALGAVASDADDARLAALATGPDESIRFAAVFALASRGGLAARNSLRERLLDPKETMAVRSAAALAIGASGDRDTIEDLRTIAANAASNLDLRVSALIALGLLSDVPTPAAVLADGAAPDGARCAAAVALGKTGDPAAEPALVAALGAASADLRGAAATALGALGRAAGADKSRLGAARDRAAAALARTGASDVSVPVRGLASIALGEVGGTEALPKLRRAMVAEKGGKKTESGDVRAAAALGLGLTREPVAGPLLRAILSARGTEEEAVVAAAATGLGLLADPSSIGPLVKALERDARPWVRAAAAESLGRLGATGAAGALEKAAAGAAADPLTSAAAVAALARLDSDPARAAVRKAARDRGDLALAARAIEAMADFSPSPTAAEDLPFLSTVAQDAAEPGAIRAAAIRALSRLASAARGPSPLERLLTDAAVLPRTDTLDIAFALR